VSDGRSSLSSPKTKEKIPNKSFQDQWKLSWFYGSRFRPRIEWFTNAESGLKRDPYVMGAKLIVILSQRRYSRQFTQAHVQDWEREIADSQTVIRPDLDSNSNYWWLKQNTQCRPFKIEDNENVRWRLTN
jgi:hypothetical protein